MSIFNGLSKKSYLLISFCISLAGIAQAGAMNETGSGSQGTTGTSEGRSGNSVTGTTGSGSSEGSSGTSQGTTGSSQGVKGSPEGSSGTSRGTYDTSPGTSETSPGTSGTSQGTTGNRGSSQGMGKIQSFQGADKNSDSYVTKSELNGSPSLLKHFDKADTNKDGQLDENEYKNLIMESEQ
ncbi:MAG: hypothetical protein ACR65R_04790 [Methylomicrobium sp.]